MTPYATDAYFEYWLLGTEIYRNPIGSRGYELADRPGFPSGTRWECSLAHFERFYRPQCVATLGIAACTVGRNWGDIR